MLGNVCKLMLGKAVVGLNVNCSKLLSFTVELFYVNFCVDRTRNVIIIIIVYNITRSI